MQGDMHLFESANGIPFIGIGMHTIVQWVPNFVVYFLFPVIFVFLFFQLVSKKTTCQNSIIALILTIFNLAIFLVFSILMSNKMLLIQMSDKHLEELETCCLGPTFYVELFMQIIIVGMFTITYIQHKRIYRKRTEL